MKIRLSIWTNWVVGMSLVIVPYDFVRAFEKVLTQNHHVGKEKFRMPQVVAEKIPEKLP
jgi:hypothetical protein